MAISLEIIEQKLIDNIKAKRQLAVDTLRSLKTRIQNEQISQSGSLSEDALVALVKSEVKRRREAQQSWVTAGRTEQAAKEEQEIEVLEEFLPEQMSEQQITEAIDLHIKNNNWQASDFGQAMGALKKEFGNSADGAVLSQILKSKLS